MISHFFTAPLPLFSRAFVSDAHLDPILVHRPPGHADALPGQGITDSLVTERFPLVFFFDYFPDQFLEFFLGHCPRRLGDRLPLGKLPAGKLPQRQAMTLCWRARLTVEMASPVSSARSASFKGCRCPGPSRKKGS